MLVDIVGALITTALIEGGKKLGTIVFREEDLRDWIQSSDFAEYFDEKIHSEAPPKPAPAPAALREFSSCDTVPLIVEQVFEQNDQSLSKLEGEFVEAFKYCTLGYEDSDPEFARWLFNVLISTFEAFLSSKARKGDQSAEEYLHTVRHKKEVEGQDEIVEKMGEVQKSVTAIQRSIERPAGRQIQKLIRWQEYFSRVEQHLMPLNTEPRLKQTAYYLKKVEEFLTDNQNRILVLHAPGGSGKSHLLRQIAFDIEGKHPEYTILLVTPGFLSLESALPGELDGDRRYLLLFDDADRWHEELAPLFAYVKYHSSNVKIILTTRTAGLRGIQAVLNEQFCQDLTEEVRIGDWSRDDLKELLRLVLGGRHHNKEGLIVSMLPNPYLIVWAGNIINGDPGITVERLQQKFVDDLKFETTRTLMPEFDKKRVGEFLADLALIGPFRRNDRVFLSLLKGRFGLSEEAIQAQIGQLVENGVLREIGYSTRFNPDMVGDLYLAHYIDCIRNSATLNGWIESWEPRFNDNILTSLEAASRFCKEDVIKDYFVSWIRKAIMEIEPGDLPGYYRTKRLEALSRFCYLVPEESINLMYTYIDIPPSGSDDDAILSPNKDTYGAVVVRLIHAGFSREEIFDLLEHIHRNVPNGQYSNYAVESLVAEAVSPCYNTLEKIRETLTLLESRLDAENEFSVIALGKALSEALRADHERSYLSSPYTITRDVRTLPATPAVFKTREHAISTLKRMLHHQSAHVRRKAVETCGEIGSQFGYEECPVSEMIAEERRIVLAEFEQLIPHETDYGVLSDIESLLFRWWQYKYPSTGDTGSILKAFPRSMGYILYGFLFYTRPLLFSFNPETIPAGEERHDWCFSVDSSFAIFTDSFTKFSERIANYLSTKYTDVDSVTTLLQELRVYLEHANLNYRLLDSLLSAWIAKNPDIFFELRDREQIWSDLPIEFKNAIDLGLCTRDQEQLESFADEILVAPQRADPRRIERFIWLMTRYPPDEARVREWLTKLIDTGEREIHLTLLYNLWSSSRFENYEICLTSYLDILSYYETMDEKLLDLIATYVLHDLRENEDRLEAHQKNAIKRCFKEILVSTPSLGIYPRYKFQALLNYVLNDTGEILNFIRQRAEKKRKTRNYQLLPLVEVSFLENVKECTELDSILDELLALMNEGLIYREQLFVQLRVITSLKHQASGKLCLEECAKHLLNEGRVDDALVLCSVLLPLPGAEDTLMTVLNCAIGAGKRKEIQKLFADYIREGVISIGAGGHSPELEQKRGVIARLLSLAPRGHQQAVLRDVLQRIDAEILDAKREYEEDFVTR